MIASHPPATPSAERAPLPAPLAAPLPKAHIWAIFIGWTLFSVYVYSRYSQLGDAQAYLAEGYDEYSQGRTLLITRIASGLRSVLGADVLVHMAFSLFAATGVCYLVAQANIRGRHRWPLLAILLNPNFGVWASVTGRESIFVGLLAFFMGTVLGRYRQRRFEHFLLAPLCVAGMIYIRGPFGTGIALFYLIYLLYAWGPRLRVSLGVQAVFVMSLAVLVLYFTWPFLDDYISNEVLPLAKSYFTVASTTTRTWVDLRTTEDLLTGMWWILPLSLIGPTLGEVIARPITLPFFVAGLIVFGLLLHSLYVALFTIPRGPIRGTLLLGWLPATMVILVAYMPFGIYNPGSGIRYASCFLLFLILPSLFLSVLPAAARGRRFVPIDPTPGSTSDPRRVIVP